MANHSSILAWNIPWTEEPGGLHSPWGHKVSDMTDPLSMHTLIRKVGFGMFMYVMKFFSLELLPFRKMTQIHTTAFFAVTNPSRSA